MKKCQICGKPATLLLTQIVNAQVTELSLCEACARERGLFDPKVLTFAEKFFPEELKERVDQVLRVLSEQQSGPRKLQRPASDVITRCQACGFSLEDYHRTGRMGCPDCYTFFAREFRLYSSAADKPGAPVRELSSRERLERQLRDAIKREDYETAALVRDELKQLS